jgi:hypothetical protein
MSLSGVLKRHEQPSNKEQGTQFEIFIEELFRHNYPKIWRNTVFEVSRSGKKIYTTQIDICCRLDRFYSLKDRYGLFELKYSNESAIGEDAVKQLMGSQSNLSRMQSKITVVPVAVVTNREFTTSAYKLAEKHNVQMINGKELWDMYTKTHYVRTLFDPDPSIDDKIRAVDVTRHMTAPNYIHIQS